MAGCVTFTTCQGLTISQAIRLPCLIVAQIGPNDKLRRDRPAFFRDREVFLAHMRQENPAYKQCRMKIMLK